MKYGTMHDKLAILLLTAAPLLLVQSCNQETAKTPEQKTNSATTGSEAQKETVEPSHARETTVSVAPVTEVVLHKTMELPGELQAFRDVKIHCKVKGFVQWIGVDRGSRVKKGDVLIKLSAPELDAQFDEARAKVVAAKAAEAEAKSAVAGDRASRVEVQAKLDSDELTLQRLRKAAKEPGAIAQNEIDTAQKTVEGDKARVTAADSKVEASQSVVAARHEAVTAAENSLKSIKDMRDYLVVRAPIDGVITERWVHEGDIAGVESKRNEEEHPLLRLEQEGTLRLVVSVPESVAGGIKVGDRLTFTVPAYIMRTFSGVVSRVGHALDVKTRTMPVELDVANGGNELEPGMYATVKWQVTRPHPTFFVPTTAVVTTLEKTFVVRVKDGTTEVTRVNTGQTMGDKIEVVGEIKPGEEVILNASDEYKSGTHVAAKLASAEELKAASKKTASAGGE